MGISGTRFTGETLFTIPERRIEEPEAIPHDAIQACDMNAVLFDPFVSASTKDTYVAPIGLLEPNGGVRLMR